MMYRTAFPRDIFAELDRLQREIQHSFELNPSIRGQNHGFPAINVGSSEDAFEIQVFLPGIDPANVDVLLEKGVLSIAGERSSVATAKAAVETTPDQPTPTLHINERFSGRFRRVITLPDDVDTSRVDAHYQDGVLHIHVARQQAAKPRRITIQ